MVELDAVKPNDIARVCEIAGMPDGTGGVDGSVTVDGAVASALITAIQLGPRMHGYLSGHPVRICRSGGLELWVNGFYIEGRGVRAIVERARLALSAGVRT